MKLINYKRGYFDKFDCVIHGTIEVSIEEFKKILPFIKKHCYDFEPSIRENFYIDSKGNYYYSFGITPIEAIVKKYKLPRYKAGNYQIKVVLKK